jgi:murein DD-endopeptidase MepM/ murein hydrolase activator NlpD
MPRLKYRYNSESLTYEKIRPKVKDYVIKYSVYGAFGIIVSFVSIAIFNAFFENPKVKSLQQELQFSEQQLSDVKAKLDTLEVLAMDLQDKDDDIYRNIFGANPYPAHLRSSGVGGSDRYRDLRGYHSSDQIIETRQRISKLERQLTAQSKSLEELYELAKRKNEMLSSIPAIQPVNNKDLTRIASGFGYRIHPIYKIRKLHTGMDFTASEGTEIYATGDGIVSRIESKRTGYGNNVMIQHGYGYQTLYAHMSKVLVKEGQMVKRGEVIGLVGNTGTSVGSHLHYEVIKDGSKINPANFFFNDLTPEQYEALLEQAQTSNQSFD